MGMMTQIEDQQLTEELSESEHFRLGRAAKVVVQIVEVQNGEIAVEAAVDGIKELLGQLLTALVTWSAHNHRGGQRRLVRQLEAARPAVLARHARLRGFDVRLHTIGAVVVVGATHTGRRIDARQIVEDATAVAQQQLCLALQLAVLARVGAVVGQIVLIREQAAAHRLLDGAYAGRGILVHGLDGYAGLAACGDNEAVVAHLGQLSWIVHQHLARREANSR